MMIKNTVAALTVLALGTVGAQASDLFKSGDSWELRGGILAHDTGVFSSAKTDGLDINAELLAPSPDFLSLLGKPRPHIGFSVATEDEAISQAYAGLTWDFFVSENWYITGAFGGAIHDGYDLS